jgi:hypothetical protein
MALGISTHGVILRSPNLINSARLQTLGNRLSPLRKILNDTFCGYAMEKIRSNHGRANVYYPYLQHSSTIGQI